jgi:hypothetical protein
MSSRGYHFEILYIRNTKPARHHSEDSLCKHEFSDFASQDCAGHLLFYADIFKIGFTPKKAYGRAYIMIPSRSAKPGQAATLPGWQVASQVWGATLLAQAALNHISNRSRPNDTLDNTHK